ncbi:MAG: cobalt ECF transporter T component CbiQ [Verrucomicrobia bacterium]|nr:cobalt ECF transporter T component CbiQ [Verrucomicrobiota bacterium]
MRAESRWLELGQMDDAARMDSAVHRLDPRAKILVTLALLVVVMSFSRYTLSALTPFLSYPLVLIALSRVPLLPLARKLLWAAPFALLVGAFNPLFDREPMLHLGGWTISGGWISFANIGIRFVLTVSAALVLIATTGMHRLCAGMERLAVPRVLVAQMLFLYRYLFVVSGEGSRMVRAAQLRAGASALSLRVYGTLVGMLLLRSLDRAERVHQAMLARGFEGSLRRLDAHSFGWREAAFVLGWLSFFAVARVWNLATLLGSAAMRAGG